MAEDEDEDESDANEQRPIHEYPSYRIFRHEQRVQASNAMEV